MNDRSKQYSVTSGILQGSMLDPPLQNVMRNHVLALPAPKETTIIDLVDDVALVAVAKQPEDIEVYANEIISAIKAWEDLD